MNGIRWEETALARKAVRTKVVEPQSITGIIRHRREPPEANPLVAGSSPARPTSEVYYLG
jgi:hypothetical protein